MKLVLCRHKRLAGKLGNLCRNQLGKSLRRVKSRADSRAAQSQLIKRLYRHAEQLRVSLKARPPAGDFLAELNRSCVLKMRTSGFYYALVLFFKAFEGFNQHFNRREELILHLNYRGNVHCGRECVV